MCSACAVVVVAAILVASAASESSCDSVRRALFSVSSNASSKLVTPTLNTAAFLTVSYEVPTYQQQFNYSCGPSSMLSVLWALGFENETELSLMAEMGTNWEVGTNFSQMVAAVDRRGLVYSAVANAHIVNIREALARGQVVIILYQAWSNETIPYINVWDSGHFSVVFGMDEGSIFVMDPWTGVLSYIPSTYFEMVRWHAPDSYGAFGICSRCMLAVGPRPDGTPRSFRAQTPAISSFIFVG